MKSKSITVEEIGKKIPFEISDLAYDKILEIRKEKGIPDHYLLRLGVKSAGCGIASHVIGFDLATERDQIFVFREMEVIVEKIQLMYLAGKKVVYDTVDGQTGFVFRTRD